MNNTPTPKTDAMASMLRTRKEWQSHGEGLERELAVAKAQLDRLVEALDGISVACFRISRGDVGDIGFAISIMRQKALVALTAVALEALAAEKGENDE